MANPNHFVDHEMQGSFAEEAHEYDSGLGSDFSDDIKQTAHFTQAQINNINRNNLAYNAETTPISKFQMPSSNENVPQEAHD